MNEENKIEWTRIDNDTNGNPRYVCHFFALIPDLVYEITVSLSDRYAIACKRANAMGGKKYHTRRFGGGIVFQSYSLPETENAIARIIKAMEVTA